MMFQSARCLVCLDYFFKPDDVVAYRIQARKPLSVELGGQAPWSGVHCVCKGCCRFLARCPEEADESPDPIRDDSSGYVL